MRQIKCLRFRIRLKWFFCNHDWKNLYPHINDEELAKAFEDPAIDEIGFSTRHKCKKCGKLTYIGSGIYLV